MTDEVRQEDRGKVAITDEDRAASDECCDYWLTRNATCNVDVEEMFARHASPLRDRIAVLEGALVNARGNLVRALASSLEISDEFAAMIPSVTMIDATLNGKKKDG